MRAERSCIGVLNAVHDASPVPSLDDLAVSGCAHARAKRVIVEQRGDGARDVFHPLRHDEAIAAVCDHLAQRCDVAADHRLLVQPRLQVADAEGLVDRWHRVHAARVERGRLLVAGRPLDLHDALVGVASELVDDRLGQNRSNMR